MNKYLKKSFALFLITVMLILSAFSSVSAASLLDTSKKVSITLNCTKPGYTFEVFEVATKQHHWYRKGNHHILQEFLNTAIFGRYDV